MLYSPRLEKACARDSRCARALKDLGRQPRCKTHSDMPLCRRTRVFLMYGLKVGEKNMTLNKNAQMKREAVAEITQKIKDSQSVVVVNTSGVTVAEITELRRKFREAGVEYKVLKNTLVRRALDDLGITSLDHLLNGPSAFAFGVKDPTSPAKIISDYIAESKNNKFQIKAGLLGANYLDVKAVEALAKMPSREELLAKMLGSLNAPATNLVGVLSATLRSLVYAIDAVRQQKEAQ